MSIWSSARIGILLTLAIVLPSCAFLFHAEPTQQLTVENRLSVPIWFYDTASDRRLSLGNVIDQKGPEWRQLFTFVPPNGTWQGSTLAIPGDAGLAFVAIDDVNQERFRTFYSKAELASANWTIEIE